jgi:GrpB-like predicted nucleotidyltransferase (UPF0157 family)
MKKVDEDITIAEYNPHWVIWYQEETAQLRNVFPNAKFEHFGSTSVSGLDSKPIVDILVGLLGVLELSDAERRKLELLGYEILGSAGVPGRIYCRKRGERSFNLAVTQFDSTLWRDNLLIRDYLRSRPDEVKNYAQHKLDAYHKGYRTLLAYSDYKADFMSRLLQRAKMERN